MSTGGVSPRSGLGSACRTVRSVLPARVPNDLWPPDRLEEGQHGLTLGESRAKSDIASRTPEVLRKRLGGRQKGKQRVAGGHAWLGRLRSEDRRPVARYSTDERVVEDGVGRFERLVRRNIVRPGTAIA